MKKKIIMIAVIGLFVLLFPLLAGAETRGSCGSGLTWVLDDNGVLTISGTGEMTSHPWNASDVLEVEILDGVTNIGNSAFYRCINLSSITIPDSVTSIGDYAFYKCSNLSSITIPESVTIIGDHAFGDCSKLTSITIPDSVTSIGDYAFGFGYSSWTRQAIYASLDSDAAKALSKAGCDFRLAGNTCNLIYLFTGNEITGLELTDCDSDATFVLIPESVTSIRSFAFAGCSSLESITIPDSVTIIGDHAFDGCSKLSSITIPDSVTIIGDAAFYVCSKLSSITIPDGVSAIPNSAFSGCRSLTSVVIPDSVTSIGLSAFYDCNSLSSINIPDGLTSVGNNAFFNCPASKYTRFDSDAANTLSKAGYGFRVLGNQFDYRYVFSDEIITGLEICNCDKDVTSIVIPDCITRIGGGAFFECGNLSNISIPDSVTSIGNNAFEGCTSLSDIIIPDSVTSIGKGAFYSCSSLSSVTIPDGVTSIADFTFEYCSALKSIIIPNSVTSIEGCAFYECSSLSSITIPYGVTSIGYAAFFKCSMLKSVTIPDTVTSIGESAFYNCSNLSRITIPDGIISIERGTFSGCRSLTSIVIPDSVTNIGIEAFRDCTRLTEIVIPDSVTSIGEHAFDNCASLRSIKIPDSVMSIGSGAFSSCSFMTNVTIPDGITNILDYTFSDCGSLMNITIPDSVGYIGEDAFEGCNNLKNVLFAIDDPDVEISFADTVFSGSPTIYCHMFTAPHTYFVNAGYNVVFIEDIDDMDSIRSISLQDDFRMSCGGSWPLLCSVFPDDGTPVQWASSDPSILTVDENGTVTALNPGTVTVTATVGEVSESLEIETYIAATAIELNMQEVWLQAAREGIQLSVTAYTPDNASANLLWSSSDTTLANVDANGYVTTLKPGDVTITATTEKDVIANCDLHLTWPVTSLTLAPASATVGMGEMLQLTATAVTSKGTYENKLVTFSSSDEDIAVVDAAGLLTAIYPGTAVITATTVNGKTAAAEITVVRCANHIPAVDEAVAPTYEEFGLTEGSHCEVCGEILTAQMEIPALGTLHVMVLPAGLREIEKEAFAGLACQAVIIPDGCTSVGSKAFADCTDLVYVQVPASVTAIAEDAFSGCPQVFVFHVGE